MGPWGDCSQDLHSLIRVMAESRVLANAHSTGYVAGEGELSCTIGSIRRVLSCAFMRAQALCLLARLGQLGPGARGAADRRVTALRAEQARRQETRANWLANVRGRGLSRVGSIFVP